MHHTNPEDIKLYLEFGIFDYFQSYNEAKDDPDFFKCNASYAKQLITTYYHVVDKPEFDLICSNFIKNYVINESELEDVRDVREQEGLAAIYENTIHKHVPDSMLNIHMLLKIHQMLYSKCPYPEAGGVYRSQDVSGTVFLTETNLELVPSEDVIPLINGLYDESVELFERGKNLGVNKDPEAVIQFIKDCLRFKCKIIKIHPFNDGNGRSSRALMNLMFKMANIPPVYVTHDEKKAYRDAMFKAIKFNDYADLECFYDYKILDSIYQLDVLPKMKANKRNNT